MLSLSRTVRISLGPPPTAAASHDPTGGNGLVSVCPAAGLAPTVELEVACRGALVGSAKASGYLVDITVIDRAVRDRVAPLLRAALRDELDGTPTDLLRLLTQCASTLAPALPAHLATLTYRSSPFRSASLEHPTDSVPTPEGSPSMQHAFVLTETFEFAASHRLHLPAASDAENRALFGKCNNPNGHGHNYRIEVAAAVPATERPRLDFAAIERIVQSEIMARFDHKHLNLDCPEFANLNPSVEHIAMVCHGLLAPRFAEVGAALRWVRVWETEKTSCRYPA